MRSFRIAVITALLLVVSGSALAQSAVQTGDPAKRGLTQADFPILKQIVPGLYTYTAYPPSKILVTAGFVVTRDGVLVVDGLGSVEETQKFVDTIKKTTSQPVKYVVITTDHGDHTAGNSAYRAAFPGVVFVGSPVTQKNLANTPNPPTEIVTGTRALTMGGTEIQILTLGRAHTGGDLQVYLPKDKVMFMGEAYFHRLFPSMRAGYPSEWVETIRKALAMNATWYIGAHGFVDDAATMKSELEKARVLIVAIIAEAKRLHTAKIPCVPSLPVPPGAVPAQSCEAAQKADWGRYADWTLVPALAETDILRVYQELDGKL